MSKHIDHCRNPMTLGIHISHLLPISSSCILRFEFLNNVWIRPLISSPLLFSQPRWRHFWLGHLESFPTFTLAFSNVFSQGQDELPKCKSLRDSISVHKCEWFLLFWDERTKPSMRPWVCLLLSFCSLLFNFYSMFQPQPKYQFLWAPPWASLTRSEICT